MEILITTRCAEILYCCDGERMILQLDCSCQSCRVMFTVLLLVNTLH